MIELRWLERKVPAKVRAIVPAVRVLQYREMYRAEGVETATAWRAVPTVSEQETQR